MIEINSWMKIFLRKIHEEFGERIWFVGLQGSYGRGEATESSDIDIVVILNELSCNDIQKYNDLINSLPHRELICGFLSGKEELINWEASELFQFYYDTKPIIGSLETLLDSLNDDSVRRAIKIGVCTIYHSCIHNMLYEKSDEILFSLYKSSTFVIQAISFLQNGHYITRINDLMYVVDEQCQEILQIFLKLKNGEESDFQAMSDIIFKWSQKWINTNHF